MRAPAWLWPTSRKPDATFAVRLGRLLHWAGVLTGVLVMLAVAIAITGHLVTPPPQPWQLGWKHMSWEEAQTLAQPAPFWPDIIAALIIGGALIIVGRGARYLIADE